MSPVDNAQLHRERPPSTGAPHTLMDKVDSTRLHLDEVKRDIVQQYEAWLRSGKRLVDSPIAELMEKYGCARTYPTKLYNQFIARCSVENQWNENGRPLVYGEETDAKIVGAIRAKRSEQKIASCRYISRNIKKENRRKPAPSKNTVNRKKKKLGFKKYNVQKKPTAPSWRGWRRMR